MTLLRWCALTLVCGSFAASAVTAQDQSSASSAFVAAASLTAPDVERAAVFYETVFGFSEIRRIDQRPQFLEIVLKPGADAAAARAAPGAALILISRPASASPDIPGLEGWSRARLALVVPRMAPVIAKATAAGGVVIVAPYQAGGSLQSEVDTHPGARGMHVDAMIRDPGGNYVELLAPE